MSVKMNWKGARKLCEHGSQRAEALSEGQKREMTTRGRISQSGAPTSSWAKGALKALIEK